jgi:hypothetical protein
VAIPSLNHSRQARRLRVPTPAQSAGKSSFVLAGAEYARAERPRLKRVLLTGPSCRRAMPAGARSPFGPFASALMANDREEV